MSTRTAAAPAVSLGLAVVGLTVAGLAGLAGLTAPAAHANGADAVISSLRAEGYQVHINWLNGFQNDPQLWRCTVVRVNNPSSAAPKPGDVVYVDVTCAGTVR